MMQHVKFWQSKTFRIWLSCYFVIMLLPTMFSIVFFHHTSEQLTAITNESGEIAITQIRDLADEYLAQIVAVSNTVYMSPDIKKLSSVTLPFDAEKYLYVHEKISYLQNFDFKWKLIDNLYIYHGNLDCILDSGHIYTKVNQYDKVISDHLGLSNDEFMEYVGQTQLHTIRISDDGQRILCFRTLTSDGGKTKRPVMTLIISLNTDSIRQILQNTEQSMNGSAFAITEDGRVFGNSPASFDADYASLAQDSATDWVRTSDCVVVSRDTDTLPIRFVLAIPCASFLRDINQARTLFCVSLALVLAISAGIAYWLASRCYRPLHRLKECASVDARQNDDFVELTNKLTQLRDSGEQLKQDIDRLNRIASERLFDLLINGELQQIDAKQRQTLRGLIHDNVVTAALIVADSLPAEGEDGTGREGDILRIMLNKVANDTVHDGTRVVIRPVEDHCAAVFSFRQGMTQQEAIAEAERICTALHDTIHRLLNVNIQIFLGDIVTSAEEVGASYRHARELREYAEMADASGRDVMMYDHEVLSMHIQPGDIDILGIERRFTTEMMNGEYNLGAQSLHEIFSYYNYRDGMNLYLMRCRMFGIMNMMINVLHDVEPDVGVDFFEETDPIAAVLSARSMKELENAMLGIIDQLVGRQETHSTNIRDKMDQVERYVRQHYHEPDLGVEQIADAFHVSLPYLSRVFKQERGIGLLDYINRCRVSTAKELIISCPELTINAIAERVGCSSSQSFFRMFKRYEGVTPGSLRQSAAEQADRKK